MYLNNTVISKLETVLDYNFLNKELISLAMTHPSYANEYGRDKSYNNQRLEFLGDSLINLIITQHLFLKYPEKLEGELTKLRARIVCEDTLALFSCKLNLEGYILLGKGEEINNGRMKKSIQADLFEALIGAIFLDQGFDVVNTYLLAILKKHYDEEKLASDYKTQLQEIVYGNKMGEIKYNCIGESGPDHKKTFIINVTIGNKVYGEGSGSSIKSAEQSAAGKAMAKLV